MSAKDFKDLVITRYANLTTVEVRLDDRQTVSIFNGDQETQVYEDWKSYREPLYKPPMMYDD